MVFEVENIRFLNYVGLWSEVEKEHKSNNAYIYNKKPSLLYYGFNLLLSLKKLSTNKSTKDIFMGGEGFLISTTTDKQWKTEALRYNVLILSTKQIHPLTKSLSQFQASLQNNTSP